MSLATKLPSEENDAMIDAINNSNIGWKADVCGYTKTNPNRPATCDTKMHVQTGLNEGQQLFLQSESKAFKDSYAEATKWLHKYNHASLIQDDELPENFDWRNMNGVDYTNEVRH